MYRDGLPVLISQGGYGELGMHGSLGYEGKQVSVQERRCERALNAHPPARLVFRFDKRYASFTCQVALNDDVLFGASDANLFVLTEGRQVAVKLSALFFAVLDACPENRS